MNKFIIIPIFITILFAEICECKQWTELHGVVAIDVHLFMVYLKNVAKVFGLVLTNELIEKLLIWLEKIEKQEKDNEIYDEMKSKWVKFLKDALIPDEYVDDYAKKFINNRISFDMIHKLDKSLLNEMGITVIGDCLNILNKNPNATHEGNEGGDGKNSNGKNCNGNNINVMKKQASNKENIENSDSDDSDEDDVDDDEEHSSTDEIDMSDSEDENEYARKKLNIVEKIVKCFEQIAKEHTGRQPRRLDYAAKFSKLSYIADPPANVYAINRLQEGLSPVEFDNFLALFKILFGGPKEHDTDYLCTSYIYYLDEDSATLYNVIRFMHKYRFGYANICITKFKKLGKIQEAGRRKKEKYVGKNLKLRKENLGISEALLNEIDKIKMDYIGDYVFTESSF